MKVYYLDINPQDHRLKTKVFKKYVKTHNFFFYIFITFIYDLIGYLIC